MKYTYYFTAHPDETWGFDSSVFNLFRMFRHGMEMHFTEEEFGRFRRGLAGHGITLRSIERWPYVDPEPVL